MNETKEKSKIISGLDYDLTLTRSEKNETTNKLSVAIERERARLHDLITVHVQTEPFITDSATQTDFIVPPVSFTCLITSLIPALSLLSLCLSLVCFRCHSDTVSQMKLRRAVLDHQKPSFLW
jgi:hypothetical protein